MQEDDLKKDELIGKRHLVEADIPFIYSTWLSGLYFAYNSTNPRSRNLIDSWISNIPEYAFNKEYKKVIERILSKSDVNVAYLIEDPNTVLGYAVFKDETLHWVYVKNTWRGIGVAADLVPKIIKYASHLTPTGKTICYRKHITFDPFKI